MMKRALLTSLFTLTLLMVSTVRHAHAQCETPVAATTAMSALMTAQTAHINQYVQQEINFMDKDLKETATEEVMDRFDQFRNNILDALNAYAERLIPEMRDMTKQLSTAEVEQTRQQGSFEDARLQNETIRRADAMHARVERENRDQAISSCVLDTLGPAQTRGYRLARGVAGGLARDAGRELGNARGVPGATGPAAMTAVINERFEDLYCDPQRGDQGCERPGRLAGRNNDLAGILWGEQQTLDLTAPENVQVLRDVTRNIAGPLPPQPLPASEVTTAAGIQEQMRRRAHRARVNTIYNAVGQMTGQRVGGTGANTQEIRTAAGTPATAASTNASASEINEAITRDRFSNPEYLFRMVNGPVGLVRELGAVNAIRMMQINDLYKRMEELVWIEGAMLGAMLDQRQQ